MSIMTDTIISATQTIYDKDDYDYKQLILVFDENQTSYQILAWHSCQISFEFDRQLIILVKENKNENNWLGTLTTTRENTSLIWKNNLNHRQHQLHLSEQANSIITHFEIQEVIDSTFKGTKTPESIKIVTERFPQYEIFKFLFFLVHAFIDSLYFIELYHAESYFFLFILSKFTYY
jgi:hypothetical protein